MLIYAVDHSLYCAKLRLVLRSKGLDWTEALPPGGVGSDRYLEIVPTGNLPALVDDTLVLTDSEAIAEYLEEKHPSPPMLPDGLVARAWSRERSRFHDTRLEPALRDLFAHVSPDHRDARVVERARRGLERRMQALATLLERAPLPRERLWLGDCGLIVTLAWIKLFEGTVIEPLIWPNAVMRYLDDMSQRPAVAQEMAQYEPHMRDWIAAKTG